MHGWQTIDDVGRMRLVQDRLDRLMREAESERIARAARTVHEAGAPHGGKRLATNGPGRHAGRERAAADAVACPAPCTGSLAPGPR